MRPPSDVSSGSALQGLDDCCVDAQPRRRPALCAKQIRGERGDRLHQHHSKRSILTEYLNSVPYGTVGGQTAIGVQAAARIFFSKPVSELNLAQAALLAGLPQAPSQYNPFRNPSDATQRRNQVLAKMAQLHYITPSQAHAAEQKGLELHRGYYYQERRESFFFEYVREALERYGSKTVQRGGLYTTITTPAPRPQRSPTANNPKTPLRRSSRSTRQRQISKRWPVRELREVPV